MKNARKLIPALAMLLVATVMMSTASYAWFSMNSTVTASSLSIKATTDANLFIANGASVQLAQITGTSASFTAKNDAVLPADMSDSNGTVTVRIADEYSEAPTVGTAGAASTWESIGTLTQTVGTDGTDKDLDKYCVFNYVTIARKATTAATYSLTPKCTVTLNTASDLNKALRVGLIINGKFYESGDVDAASGSAEFTFSAIAGLDDNVAYSACLVMWFEGEDSDCFVNNAISLSENVAAWEFTSA